MVFAVVMSTLIAVAITLASPARAHEVQPTIADVTRDGDRLVFDLRINLESFLAGVDLAATDNTDETPQADRYEMLHALPPAELAAEFEAYWPQMAERINVEVDGASVQLMLESVTPGAVMAADVARLSMMQFSAILPEDAEMVRVGWAPEFGDLVLVQQGVLQPFDAYLTPGAVSPPFSIAGGTQASGLETFFNYIPVGFDHIVPLGLDHILFVLGLFFFSTNFKPLLWQVSAFTLAHTITLALAGLGYVTVSPDIVEPLIAASIIYVAVENIFGDGDLPPWRPVFIFGLGLLHGLGFASVLGDYGLPEGSFLPALIGFNIGVEVGQLAVIAVAYLCVFKAVDLAKTGEASKPLTILFLGLMILAMLAIIPVSSVANPEMRDTMLAITGGIAALLGLTAAALSVARYDSYREVVAMPASILIAATATYWTIERVFL